MKPKYGSIFDSAIPSNEGDGMKSAAIVMVFIFAGLTASGVQAEIYSWTDQNGVKHYSHTPAPEGTAQIKTTREISTSPEPAQADKKIDEENIEAILDELDKENKTAAPKPSSSKLKLSRQERIQNEQTILEEKLAYLENLPADAFANSRSRNVIIGQYQYRLQQLMSDPDSYYNKYGF
jgi:hypothetical protein